MSAPAYRRYERNEVQPTIDRMSQLADIYKISLDALCWGSDEEKSALVSQGEQFSILITVGGGRIKIDGHSMKEIAAITKKTTRHK